MHTPVLLQDTIDALNVQSGERYIDATYGEGGHTRKILEKGGKVLALDWDEENVQRQNVILQRTCVGFVKNQSVKLVYGNYAHIKNIAQEYNFVPCKGIIFDLGLSMEQIRLSGRGFSYERGDEPLDMRISLQLNVRAGDIINSYSRDQLYEIFARNAEEINSGTIAEAIDRTRSVKHIRTVNDLIEVIKKVTKNKQTVARIFQALRVEVNHEFENIRNGLLGALDIIDSDGRIVIISFHQTEDRIIKNLIRELGLKGSKKPIVSKNGERFERSAKLRIITR